MAEARNLADSEDLILHILVKLPVKSLQRCKCVCKSWFHLIENPNFIHRHLDYHKHNDTILMLEQLSVEDEIVSVIPFYSYESISIISPSLVIPCFNGESMALCGPSNGLVCVANCKNRFVLCNPSLREFKPLPPYPFPITGKWTCCVDCLGLGFDTATNDHKFLVKCYVRDNTVERFDPEQKVLVYSLSTDSWREIDTDMNFRIGEWNCVGTPFNGTLHWIEEVVGTSQKLLRFDMKTEVFSYLELPRIDRNNTICLKVLDESLALFAYSPNFSTVQFIDVWVMHKYAWKIHGQRNSLLAPSPESLLLCFCGRMKLS